MASTSETEVHVPAGAGESVDPVRAAERVAAALRRDPAAHLARDGASIEYSSLMLARRGSPLHPAGRGTITVHGSERGYRVRLFQDFRALRVLLAVPLTGIALFIVLGDPLPEITGAGKIAGQALTAGVLIPWVYVMWYAAGKGMTVQRMERLIRSALEG